MLAQEVRSDSISVPALSYLGQLRSKADSGYAIALISDSIRQLVPRAQTQRRSSVLCMNGVTLMKKNLRSVALRERREGQRMPRKSTVTILLINSRRQICLCDSQSMAQLIWALNAWVDTCTNESSCTNVKARVKQ